MALEVPKQFEQYLFTCQPQDLLKEAQKTAHPLVYINSQIPVEHDPNKLNIVVVFGGSGSGKDTVIQTAKAKGLVIFATTATSRDRRENEPEDTYVWMEKALINETQEEYLQRMIARYSLIEHDFHNNQLYGLPESKLVEAMGRGTALLRMDHTGAKMIKEIMGQKASVISLFVVPDSLEQVWERIQGRGADEKRFQETIDQILLAPTLANFYLHNPAGKIAEAQQAFEWLIGQIA